MKPSDYNNFSPIYKRTLKPDERATYRVLNVRPDPDNYGRILIPAALQIPSVDDFYDKVKGEYIKIAAIERSDEKGEAVFLSIVFSASNMGYLFLNGNNPVHQKIYQFLELCNFNKSNKDRNDIYEEMFCRIDNEKEAKEERQLRKIIAKAVTVAIDLEESKAREVGQALGIDAESIEEIRNLVEDFAASEPEEFLQVVERASLTTESLLKDAVKKGIIKNNINAQVFEWVDTEKEIFKYKKAAGKNYFKELADYLEENNPDELNAIKTRLG
jgi:DNA-dependent RNA polymerase auxiliary subunit epsilon